MESTLALRLTDLQSEVGSYEGWGRGPDAGEEIWVAEKLRAIRSCVATGLRWFYFQAHLRPDDPVHKWTFLSPVASLPLVQGGTDVTLPDDFGGLEGLIVVTTPDTGTFTPVRLGNPEEVRLAQARTPNTTGRPQLAAFEASREQGPGVGPRQKLVIFPASDREYLLKFNYYFLPDYLTVANPFPYGGAAHAETMKAAVRAAAEKLYDNVADGVEWQGYQMSLSASIAYDRRFKPQVMGYNGDMSDFRFGPLATGRMPWWAYGRYGFGTITIAGADPG